MHRELMAEADEGPAGRLPLIQRGSRVRTGATYLDWRRITITWTGATGIASAQSQSPRTSGRGRPKPSAQGEDEENRAQTSLARLSIPSGRGAGRTNLSSTRSSDAR